MSIALLGLLFLLPSNDGPDFSTDPLDPVIGIKDEREEEGSGSSADGTGDNGAKDTLLDYDLYYCKPSNPEGAADVCVLVEDPPAVTVTPDLVLSEARRVTLPRLRVTVQPAGSTLVNLETIFHTTAARFERTVGILDSTVDLRAEPAAFTWHHGDGSTQTTTSPGRPYPAMDVIHQYKEPGSVTPRVDVTYRVTYRIDDGDWQSLDTTITAPGPGTALRIREARPVLTD